MFEAFPYWAVMFSRNSAAYGWDAANKGHKATKGLARSYLCAQFADQTRS